MDGVTWNYTYNSDGLRTVRTSNSKHYSYVYNGDKLTYMTAGDKHMYFAYDANGTPMSIVYSGTVYYYVTNVQGDVIALVDSTGAEVVSYSYDAWGKPLETTGTLKDTLGVDNPLRYRGYVYDQETGLYYLQSRYYNPEIGRFINGDDPAYLGVDGSLKSYNLFSYCGNNPISMSDHAGTFGVLTGIAIAGIAISAIVGGVVAGVSTAMSGGSVGEIIASSAIGAVTAGGIATAAALGAAGSLAVGAVAAISAAIGAGGEIASISVEHAYHKNDSGYEFNWGAACTRVAYAAGISALSGSISYGLNKVYTGADEAIGLAISSEAAIALGSVDFGARKIISVATEPSSSTASTRRLVIPKYRRAVAR